MKNTLSLFCYFLMALCASTIECEGQGNFKSASWHPDIYILCKTNTLWGPETNHIQAGLNIQYSTDSSGRTLVGFVVAMYWNSDTNGNFRPDLMYLSLAPTNSRYTMALYDERGEAVSKTQFGMEHSQLVNTHPKDLYFYHGYGPVDLVPFQCFALNSENGVLGDYFVITNAGKYHLRFVLNAFKGDDSGIQPLCFPVDADIEIKNP